MFGSLYSFPRGLVLVATRGFYPKITSITLPKSEIGVMEGLFEAAAALQQGTDALGGL